MNLSVLCFLSLCFIFVSNRSFPHILTQAVINEMQCLLFLRWAVFVQRVQCGHGGHWRSGCSAASTLACHEYNFFLRSVYNTVKTGSHLTCALGTQHAPSDEWTCLRAATRTADGGRRQLRVWEGKASSWLPRLQPPRGGHTPNRGRAKRSS